MTSMGVFWANTTAHARALRQIASTRGWLNHFSARHHMRESLVDHTAMNKVVQVYFVGLTGIAVTPGLWSWVIHYYFDSFMRIFYGG